jgi:hypothetical protein
VRYQLRDHALDLLRPIMKIFFRGSSPFTFERSLDRLQHHRHLFIGVAAVIKSTYAILRISVVSALDYYRGLGIRDRTTMGASVWHIKEAVEKGI